ncbi:MAG: tyrosine-type recombinase/integrase [Actinomycetota bacterium]|nr:tyrosine-type recombinase/integrase [Actinomycetota bacterium]
MSTLAPTLQAFFTERLMRQRQASPHTIAAYRDTFRLLFAFAEEKTGRAPSNLRLEDLDAPLIGAFLDHLEVDRHNSIRTRNARLAAIHAMFRFAALRHPEISALIQRVLAIPEKRGERGLVTFLNQDEIDALLAAPDRARWVGRRDHALLLTAIQTGLRVSEITALTCQDIELRAGAHLRCHGKGRKDRVTPLTDQAVSVLRIWLAESQGAPTDPLFPGPRGVPLTRDAVAAAVSKYAAVASERCPSLRNKTVSPHVLRHTCAMQLLQAGVDTSVIALWLGHESAETTQIYLHADLAIKERALARTAPPNTTPGRYQPSDDLLAFLESL